MASISKKSKDKKTTSGMNETVLKALAMDAIRISEQKGISRFIGFLDESERQIVQALLHQEQLNRYRFFGGYPEAERTFLGVFPDDEESGTEEFPITALAFEYRTGVSLSHRDFLGTLLSCGIKREKIGDILCSNGLSVAFVDKEISHFLAMQITKVGGEGVTLLENYKGDFPVSHQFKEIHDTVASPRLDAVIKVAVGISREEAVCSIEAGQVSVNHVLCISSSKNVQEKDILSVRGVGRFILDKVGPVTKKGRLFITVKKYL